MYVRATLEGEGAMDRFVRRHLATIVVAMVTAAVTAAAPSIAAVVADFARNAGKLDGHDSAKATAKANKRRNRVAVYGKAGGVKGRLPGNAVERPENTLVVAKHGGDFTSVQAA